MKPVHISELLLATAIAWPTLVAAQSYRDKEFNALELSKMPKYCYAQYVNDKLANDPMYSIQGCGAYTNHFCGAILSLIRADNTARSTAQRKHDVSVAIRESYYTLNNMPEGCWLRPDAEEVLRRARERETTLQ